MDEGKKSANKPAYYILYPDPDAENLDAVEDYELGDFPVTTFWEGEPFTGRLPPTVRLYVSGEPADCLGNPLSWLMVSDRCLELMRPLLDSRVQTIPITVYSPATKEPVRHYNIVNPVGTVDAIFCPGRKKSSVSLMELVLDPDKIPEDRHLFRLKHSGTTIIISRALLAAIKGKGLKGLVATKVRLRKPG